MPPWPLSFSAPMSDPTVPKRFPCLFQVSILTGLPRVQLVVVRHRRHIRTDRSCCVVLRVVLVAVSVDVRQGGGTSGWTVMCWQQLGSDKYKHVHNNHNNKRVTRPRRMRKVWHVACMGSAKCIQNYSGKTWRKETTVSSRKAHGQAVAYSTHTESSRGALAQLFFFKHVQSTTDKIALLWQQALFRCLSGQWRKHGRWHEQMHSHTNNQHFFWPQLIVTWPWPDLEWTVRVPPCSI